MITQGFPKQCQPIRSSRMASYETLKKFDFRKKNSKFVEPMFQRRRRHDAAHIRFRVNTNVQLEVMERSVLPWITSIAVGPPESGSRTLPPVMCLIGLWPGSRGTAATSSPRSNGLPAAPTLIRWIILFGATSRPIPIHVPTHHQGKYDCIHKEALCVPPQGPGDQALFPVQKRIEAVIEAEDENTD